MNLLSGFDLALPSGPANLYLSDREVGWILANRAGPGKVYVALTAMCRSDCCFSATQA